MLSLSLAQSHNAAGHDAHRLMTTSDPARAFDLLSANPKAHYILILRSLGRLMLLDATATVDLAVSLYPMLRVGFGV
jgi:hypothetical protein